jgi:RNA polymerase sigma-70 factor (ECF subfamily)
MCLLAARLPARVDAVGELSTLARQDRALWDRNFLALGMAHFERAIEGDELTVYHCEAAIAACHAAAPRYADTDWRTVLARYDQLLALNDTPIVRLNRAVAMAKVHGAGRALRELDTLEAEPALAEYYLLPATRGLLLWTLGRHADAAAAFRRAVARPCSEPERHFIEKRVAACEAGEPPIDF